MSSQSSVKESKNTSFHPISRPPPCSEEVKQVFHMMVLSDKLALPYSMMIALINDNLSERTKMIRWLYRQVSSILIGHFHPAYALFLIDFSNSLLLETAVFSVILLYVSWTPILPLSIKNNLISYRIPPAWHLQPPHHLF